MRLSHLSTPFFLTLTAAACIEQGPLEAEDQAQEIVGGTATQITSVPWQVSMQTAQGSHFCGGSIIAPTWIATASHCVAEGAPGRIVAGISQLSQSGSGQVRNVKRVIMAPGYTDPTAGKDAALIELTAPLTINGTTVKAIRPVTAASPAALTNAGVTTTVSGWGLTTEGGQNLPDQLQSVQVPIIALATASQLYGQTLTSDQLAAGVTAGGRDSCQGDSGGPLVVADGGEMVLAGIVSWGEGCARANRPGLYARVSSFSKWMDSYVGGPPVAAAGDDRSASPGAVVQLDAGASKDAGFGVITGYAWRQVSGPTVTIDSAGAKTASFTAPSSNGIVELELTVTDEQGLTSTDKLAVTVKPGGGSSNGNTDGGGSASGDDDVIVGGCSAQHGASPALLLLALGALLMRRRRA